MKNNYMKLNHSYNLHRIFATSHFVQYIIPKDQPYINVYIHTYIN